MVALFLPYQPYSTTKNFLKQGKDYLAKLNNLSGSLTFSTGFHTYNPSPV